MNKWLIYSSSLQGAPPGFIFNRKIEPGFNTTPLGHAAMMNYITIAKMLLEHGADTEVVDIHSRSTTLFWAAWQGHEAMVKLLIDRGAKVDATNKYGETPWQYAQDHKHEVVAKLLSERSGIKVPCIDLRKEEN